jgi:hypothetical protein
MTKRIWLILIAILAIAAFLPIVYWQSVSIDGSNVPLLFGVSFGGKTACEAKLLIDEVKGYTNFFLVNSWDLSINETALNEVCDYAAKADLSFIVFFDFISFDPKGYSWHSEWIVKAEEKWKDKFMGIYIYEEPGGKQIDTGLFDEFTMGRLDVPERFANASSYSEAADIFVTELPKDQSFEFLKNNGIPKFTSDYALYWFDYLAGYDTVFVELGWNHSRYQQIGLCRGAANVQGKEWGAIITWTYDDPPYLASGSEILEDMLIAYRSGAKYVIIFNYPTYPEDNLYGTLSEEHFAAMQQFWTHINEHPEEYGSEKGQVVFVLPKDYGWGMRWPYDSIWGLWPADNLSSAIWNKMNKLAESYGFQLDIVYNDPQFSFDEYSEVYYWNS